MTPTYQKPCAAWAEQLAASPKDLTWAERAALDQHIASCPACAATRAAYQQMDSDLVAMPLIEPRRVYAEQLPERDAQLSSPVLAGSVRSTPSQQVERPGSRQTRTDENFREKPFAPRRARFRHIMATLAAVLVVCALSGSAALLFSHHSSPGVGTPASHSGPLTVYAALSNGTVYALRPDSGAIRWQRQLDLSGQNIIGGPTIAHGVVYVGATNGSLYALRASDGTLLWQRALGATPVHPVAGNDAQVIYVGASSMLYALRTSDGSVLWQQAVSSGPSIAITAAPVAVAGGRVYASNGAARLLALDSVDGHIVWQGAYYSGVALVVAGNKIFSTVGTGEQIEVLRASDGQMLHMLSVQGNLGFDGGKLYVANQESGKLFILRPQDERIIGQVSMACPVSDSPVPLTVQDGLVYSYGSNWVCAMHAANGQKIWRWTGTRSAALVVGLIAANHHLYFLYTDSDYAQVQLYALNSGNGAQLWKFAFTSSFPYGGSFAVGN